MDGFYKEDFSPINRGGLRGKFLKIISPKVRLKSVLNPPNQ
jgi:hypothetical protein